MGLGLRLRLGLVLGLGLGLVFTFSTCKLSLQKAYITFTRTTPQCHSQEQVTVKNKLQSVTKNWIL